MQGVLDGKRNISTHLNSKENLPCLCVTSEYPAWSMHQDVIMTLV